MKVQWRGNVLALVGMGYMLMLIVFVALLFEEGMTVSQAYDIVNGPVMALIGGSLAIAKDLIDGDSPDQHRSEETEHTHKNQENPPSPDEKGP